LTAVSRRSSSPPAPTASRSDPPFWRSALVAHAPPSELLRPARPCRRARPDAPAIYEGGGPLSGVDILTVSRAGEVFVCEDGGDMDICVIEPGGAVAPFQKLTGTAAEGLPERGNEMAGVVFDRSGRRLYIAGQRAYGFGVEYRVTSPFRRPSGTARTPRAGVTQVATRRVRAPLSSASSASTTPRARSSAASIDAGETCSGVSSA
jgi:hypothetical protein